MALGRLLPLPIRRVLYRRTMTRRNDWHRGAVGGMWDEIGRLQFDFLVSEGLKPDHRFLDVGCGSLRGGRFFVEYLDKGHYFGIEKEESLARAGLDVELPRYALRDKNPRVIISDSFDVDRFADVTFEFALAQSLFTHLDPDQISLCVERVATHLAAGGRFYATFFRGDRVELGSRYESRRDEWSRTRYPLNLFERIAQPAGITVRDIGDWGHPRGQQMMVFERPG